MKKGAASYGSDTGCEWGDKEDVFEAECRLDVVACGCFGDDELVESRRHLEGVECERAGGAIVDSKGLVAEFRC